MSSVFPTPNPDAKRWRHDHLGALDLETTCANPMEAHIVQYASLFVSPEGKPTKQSKGRLVNPGVPISEGAARVHGITQARAEAEGCAHDEAVLTLLAELSYLAASKQPLVVFNAPFDLTILARHAARLGRCLPKVFVIDPLILSRALMPEAKRHKLSWVAERLGVELDNAHDAKADALCAARIAFAMCDRFPRLDCPLPLLMRAQELAAVRFRPPRHAAERWPYTPYHEAPQRAAQPLFQETV